MKLQKIRRPLRALGINLLLCATSISIFFGGAELLARLKYAPQENQPHPNSMFDYDKEKVFTLKKNLSATFKGLPFTTNSFGHRSPEITLEKPEGTKRVLVLGDSIMFGHRMLDHETSSYLLEQAFNQHFSESEKSFSVEVINTASTGNATYQEYHDLVRGLELDPDVIVLQFTLNDVMDTIGYNTSWFFDDMGMEHPETEDRSSYLYGHASTPYVDYLLKQHSAFYLFLKDMYGRIRFWDITGENIVEKAEEEQLFTTIRLIDDPDNPKIVEEWDNSLMWMKKMTDLAKEREIPFILIAIPFDFQLGRIKKDAHPQRILQTFAVEEGVYFIDLLDTLQRMYAESVVGEPVETREEIDRIIVETDMSTPDPFTEFWARYFVDYLHPSIGGNELIVSALKPIVLEILNSHQL